jgi:DNA repair exonuclease SbcCD nuclease subunit
MLHTSDIHISGDGDAIDALRAVVDTALDTGVDIVIIAGDLFDSARVGDLAVKQTLVELARLDRPVVIIPGNHDCVDDQSIYLRIDLGEAGDHIHFAGDPAGQELLFEDLGLAVWARGIENHDPENRPLEGYTPGPADYWRVVVTHGHYVARGEDSYRSSQITQDEIGALGCQYLALGHWHRFLDVSEGSTTAYYSGSPSQPGREGPSVNLVTLDPDTGVHVERRPLEGLPDPYA